MASSLTLYSIKTEQFFANLFRKINFKINFSKMTLTIKIKHRSKIVLLKLILLVYAFFTYNFVANRIMFLNND